MLNIGLWPERFEEIDLFDWQSEVKDLLSVADLAAGHTLEIGTRRYFYFRKDRTGEIVERFGLKPVTAANIRERFMAFCLAQGLPAERPAARMARAAERSEAEIQRPMLEMAFRKYAQRGCLDYARDVSQVRFAPRLWKRLTLDRPRSSPATGRCTDRGLFFQRPRMSGAPYRRS